MAGEGWWEGDGSIRWIPGQESWSLERRDGAMRGTVVGQDLLMNTWVTIQGLPQTFRQERFCRSLDS